VKKLLLALLVIGGLLVVFAYWISAPRSVSASEELFTYVAVQKGDLNDVVSATGRLQPSNLVVVGSEFPGQVVEVRGEVNQVVTAGEVLVKLDDRQTRFKEAAARHGVEMAEADVARAQASKLAAEMALKTQQELAAKGGLRNELERAQVELKGASAGVKAAEARLLAAITDQQQAQLVLRMRELKVPTASISESPGQDRDRQEFVILEKNVQLGQTVGPQMPTPLFTLAGNLAKMEIHTEVVEGDVGKLRKGLDAVFTISSYAEPDRKFTGRVHDIRPLPLNVRGAVYYNAILKVDNEKNSATGEWRLRPGMTASVDIILRRHKNVWKVPTSALNFQMEDAYQSPDARARLAEWQQRRDWNDWRPVWTWEADHNHVWPLFVRISDGSTGRTGIQDGEYTEVLEWAPGTEPGPEGLQLINNAPPAQEAGLLERPAMIKL
jgi:HlyD family secretion protein